MFGIADWSLFSGAAAHQVKIRNSCITLFSCGSKTFSSINSKDNIRFLCKPQADTPLQEERGLESFEAPSTNKIKKTQTALKSIPKLAASIFVGYLSILVTKTARAMWDTCCWMWDTVTWRLTTWALSSLSIYIRIRGLHTYLLQWRFRP